MMLMSFTRHTLRALQYRVQVLQLHFMIGVIHFATCMWSSQMDADEPQVAGVLLDDTSGCFQN